MEYFDILNEDGSITSQKSSRRDVHLHGYFHSGIMVFIIDENFNVLIQKRVNTKDSNPGKWDVSCAGHVQSGEEYLFAAKRELFEELGLNIDIEQLTFIGKTRISYSAIFHNEVFYENELDKIFIYKTTSSTQLTLQPEEVAAVRWITVAELINLFIKNTTCIFESALESFLEYYNGKPSVPRLYTQKTLKIVPPPKKS